MTHLLPSLKSFQGPSLWPEAQRLAPRRGKGNGNSGDDCFCRIFQERRAPGLPAGRVPSDSHCMCGCLHPSPPPGRINVKNEELEAMVKEAPGPINFTVFLTMFGEKLKGE